MALPFFPGCRTRASKDCDTVRDVRRCTHELKRLSGSLRCPPCISHDHERRRFVERKSADTAVGMYEYATRLTCSEHGSSSKKQQPIIADRRSRTLGGLSMLDIFVLLYKGDSREVWQRAKTIHQLKAPRFFRETSVAPR